MYLKTQGVVGRALRLFGLLSFLSSGSALAQNLSCAESIGDVVIVGPYSSGIELAPLAREMKFRPIAVIPPKAPYNLGPRLSDFDKVVIADMPVDDVVSQILQGAGTIRAVIPGSEWDPAFADAIRENLRHRGIATLGNSTYLSSARQNKRDFYRRLDEKGIPTIAHFESNNLDSVMGWVRRHGKWPVVVKPPTNAGGTGVRFCYNEEDVEDAFKSIITGKLNDMLREDEVVSVQERITDPEFAVNGIRSNGRTFITGIWEYERKDVDGASTIYVADRLSGVWGKMQMDLVIRTIETLAAVKHNTGPFHLELFYSSLRGALPNDLGARLSGGGLPSLEQLATNRNPFKMTMQSFLAPNELTDVPIQYERFKHAAVVFVSTKSENALASHELKGELEDLKSRKRIVGYTFNVADGKALKKTTDSDSIVAVVKITGDTREEVEEIVSQITLWQNQRRFEKLP